MKQMGLFVGLVTRPALSVPNNDWSQQQKLCNQATLAYKPIGFRGGKHMHHLTAILTGKFHKSSFGSL